MKSNRMSRVQGQPGSGQESVESHSDAAEPTLPHGSRTASRRQFLSQLMMAGAGTAAIGQWAQCGTRHCAGHHR